MSPTQRFLIFWIAFIVTITAVFLVAGLVREALDPEWRLLRREQSARRAAGKALGADISCLDELDRLERKAFRRGRR